MLKTLFHFSFSIFKLLVNYLKMKKLVLGLVAIALVILVVSSLSSKLPSYEPERDYLDLEEALVKEFIFAKDSSVIELPEGHFLFSQSLSLDNKKHLTIRGKGMDKTVLSFKGQKSGAEGIKITNSQHITLEDFTIEDAAGDNLKVTCRKCRPTMQVIVKMVLGQAD